MKMNHDDFKDLVDGCYTDITFSYSGLKCGIFPTVTDSRPTYDIWYGDAHISTASTDDVMNLPIFGGKPLKDILRDIDIRCY